MYCLRMILIELVVSELIHVKLKFLFYVGSYGSCKITAGRQFNPDRWFHKTKSTWGFFRCFLFCVCLYRPRTLFVRNG